MTDVAKLKEKISDLEGKNEELESELKQHRGEKEVFLKKLRGYYEQLDQILHSGGVDNEFF